MKESLLDAPLGLDKPGPALIWRLGIMRRDGANRRGHIATGLTAVDACVLRAKALMGPRSYVIYSDVYEQPLDDAIREGRELGLGRLLVYAEGKVIEEYPL